jgi:methylase of polypeptide subunit release factors
MGRSDAELVHALHRRARRAMLAGLKALNGSRANRGKATRNELSGELVHHALSLSVMRFVALAAGRARGLFRTPETFAGGRLFAVGDARLEVGVSLSGDQVVWAFPSLLEPTEAEFRDELGPALLGDDFDFAGCPAELIGNLYELLLGDSVSFDTERGFELASGKKRKQTGTFFTPRALTELVVSSALETLDRRIRASSHRNHDFVLEFRVCDPAVGGGAFLLETARALELLTSPRSDVVRRGLLATRVVHGVDINPVAVAVAEAALCLFVADPTLTLEKAGINLRVGDALLGAPHGTATRATAPRTGIHQQGVDFLREFSEVFQRGGFDLVIGNPPWVAYAGRAAQPLDPARKAYFAANYSTLKGYPTLHGLFVERALRLAPQGTVALVVPSPIADLQGYRAVRRAVRATHSPREPMLEFGQDAFASVTQPCFALIAEPSLGVTQQVAGEVPFRLAERQRAGATAAEVLPPACLAAIAELPSFPKELFGEMGFQTTGVVTKTLLKRAGVPDDRYDYPLLEGRDVHPFTEGEPRLFLNPDREALAKARCRLRDRADYGRVRFVVRQTARYPIAALHRGLPFRNSLLAGFAVDDLPAELVVGLLNSSLYRAIHLAAQRDARQATFPQVKVAHLRALPLPPLNSEARARIASLTSDFTHGRSPASAMARLDHAVFELFSLESSTAQVILAFLAARGVAVH